MATASDARALFCEQVSSSQRRLPFVYYFFEWVKQFSDGLDLCKPISVARQARQISGFKALTWFMESNSWPFIGLLFGGFYLDIELDVFRHAGGHQIIHAPFAAVDHGFKSPPHTSVFSIGLL